eukprot:6208835-Pleurochrysis_carterae.AAC.2
MAQAYCAYKYACAVLRPNPTSAVLRPNPTSTSEEVERNRSQATSVTCTALYDSASQLECRVTNGEKVWPHRRQPVRRARRLLQWCAGLRHARPKGLAPLLISARGRRCGGSHRAEGGGGCRHERRRGGRGLQPVAAGGNAAGVAHAPSGRGAPARRAAGAGISRCRPGAGAPALRACHYGGDAPPLSLCPAQREQERRGRADGAGARRRAPARRSHERQRSHPISTVRSVRAALAGRRHAIPGGHTCHAAARVAVGRSESGARHFRAKRGAIRRCLHAHGIRDGRGEQRRARLGDLRRG